MELNPNHEVTKKMRDQWYKICALVMLNQGLEHVVIDVDDIDLLGGKNIVIRERDNAIHLTIVDDVEAERLAREEGGLPI